MRLFTGIYAGPVMLFVMFMCVVFVGAYLMRGGSKPAVVYRQVPVAAPMVAPVGGIWQDAANLGIDMSSLPPVRGY
jgi:hypothetical protein